ncbi:MAG: class III poly(R)-hydroxyalkanoic acid synthase subunit PhaE [Gammaproteobacteria bacterium]|nr:class III poly(R)-hydroxyalkanoic acid synthase subunit PhaE [Gammaproteobacteria bacterium]
MTEQTSNPDWLSAQQEFWNAWFNLGKQTVAQSPASAGTAAPAQAWTDALDLWWKTVQPQVPSDSRAVFDRFIDQGKNYFQFNENFLKTFEQLSAAGSSVTDWQSFWNKALAQLKQNFSETDFINPDMMGFWEMPLENWQRTMSSVSAFPGDFFKGVGTADMRSPPGTDAFRENINRMLSIPGLGYTRERQEQFQDGMHLWLEYQKAEQKYADIFNKMGMYTVERLQEKLQARDKKGEAIADMRTLYDLWVDAGEEVYAEIVTTEEYADINAALVNTLMAWKQHMRMILDNLLSSFNMPTRKEVDVLHARIHQLRKEAGKLRETQDEILDSEALRREFHILREEIETLKANAAASSGKAAPARTRKKTAKPTGE